MYIEQLGKVDLPAMYKITTQERLLQNLMNEYEKFLDPRLVSSHDDLKLMLACLFEKSGEVG